MPHSVCRPRAVIDYALAVALLAAVALFSAAPRTAQADPTPSDPAIDALLDGQSVEVDWVEVRFADALSALAKLLDVPMIMSPAIRSEYEDVEVTLQLDDTPAASVVYMLPIVLCADDELRMFVRDGMIILADVDENIARETSYVRLYDLRNSVFSADGKPVRPEVAADVRDCLEDVLSMFDYDAFYYDSHALRQIEGTVMARVPARLHALISQILNSGRASLSSPAVSARNATLQERLTSTIIDVDFEDTPLDLVLAYLSEHVGRVFVAPEFSVFADEEVTIQLNGVPVSLVLDLVFGEALDVYWSIHHGLVLLSEDWWQPDLVAIVYDVSDLVALEDDSDFEEEDDDPYLGLVDELRTSNLIELIYDLTDENAWDYGSIMGIYPVADAPATSARVVVVQQSRVHDEIAGILAQLREYRKGE